MGGKGKVEEKKVWERQRQGWEWKVVSQGFQDWNFHGTESPTQSVSHFNTGAIKKESSYQLAILEEGPIISVRYPLFLM